MPIRRTTANDDLAVSELEALKRGLMLSQVQREAAAREAQRLRADAAPRFGIVAGDGNATQTIAED